MGKKWIVATATGRELQAWSRTRDRPTHGTWGNGFSVVTGLEIERGQFCDFLQLARLKG